MNRILLIYDYSLSIPASSYRHFSSLARRLGRIFAHAYFHHREAFEQAEAESSLYARFLALTSKFDLVPPEFLVIPPSQTDGTGQQQEVEPPRLLGAAVDPHRGHEQAGGKDDSRDRQEFVELSLEPNGEGPSDLLRSPAGPDGQRRRNRTDTMIFSEAVNIAEDLAKAQTEGEHEAPASPTELSPIGEVPEVPLISEMTTSTDDAATALSDHSLEFSDHIPTDEVEEIPLPAVIDSEPIVPEDAGEESDEEVVPEEETPDPAAVEPPAPQEALVSDPPSPMATEPPPSGSIPEEKKQEQTNASEATSLAHEAQDPPVTFEASPTTADEDEDEDEDVGEDEEESTSASGPPDLEDKGGEEDEDEEDGNGSQPADNPEVES